MKQATIQITFEEEKLRALRRYIAKRDSTLEAELQKAAQRRTVCQVQIVQQCQRVPLGKRRLNRAVRQPDSHGLPKRFQ